MKMFFIFLLGLILAAALLYAGFTIWAGILLAGILYLHTEPYFLTTTRHDHRIKGLKKPVTVIFISDLQVRFLKNKNFISRMVKKISGENPDFIIFGGDLISNESKNQNFSYLNSFEILSLKYPVYAVLGNHEYGRDFNVKNSRPVERHEDRSEEVKDILQKMKITLLCNDSAQINLKGQQLMIYGTDDLWAEKASWDNLQKSDSPLIAVTHNPDAVLSYPASFPKPDLVLSGHTHGGQIRLPLFGAIGNACTKLPRKFYQGKHTWQEFHFIISRGLGESGFAIRFWCPPEIVVLTLKPE